MADPPRAGFISLEGGEGAGKSTQIRHLARALESAGLTVVTTREPGGSPGAEAIRELLIGGDTGRWDGVTELLLHYAARRDHLTRTIRPALDRGDWVVTDRFADSTMAYQSHGQGVDPETVATLYAASIGSERPDLTLLLDLPVEEGLARAAQRNDGGQRYEAMDRAFHQRLRAGFLAIAEAEPERCLVIDATAAPEAVHGRVLEALRTRLGLAMPQSRS
jgi:dTMP kinase